MTLLFNGIWLIVGIVLGVLGTLSIYKLYNWIRTTANRVMMLRDQLRYYQQLEEDWTEFQFTRKKSK